MDWWGGGISKIGEEKKTFPVFLVFIVLSLLFLYTKAWPGLLEEGMACPFLRIMFYNASLIGKARTRGVFLKGICMTPWRTYRLAILCPSLTTNFPSPLGQFTPTYSNAPFRRKEGGGVLDGLDE